MKIFIAGAGGFIGSCLVTYLEEAGHSVEGHIRSRDGDLTPDSVPKDVGAVINAAGRLGGQGVSPEQLMESNALLPKMLGDVCGELDCSLVHLSTPGVTGLIASATEEMKYDPWGDYENSKVQGEKYLLENADLESGGLTILRPDFVYGPGDMHKFPLFRQVAKGWIPLVGFTGARLRPTYCIDVCRAVESSLPGGTLSGGTYNIAGPEVVSMREFTAAIAESLETGLVRVPVPEWIFRLSLLLGPLCPPVLSESRFKLFGRDHFVSIGKAEEAGFRPSFNLSTGLGETVAWYRDEGLLR